MEYTTQQIKVDGVWRNVLIVQSDTEVDFPNLNEIVHQVEGAQIHYITDGKMLARHVRNGVYKYWFVVTEQFTLHDGESPYVAELEQALTIALHKEVG